MHWRTVTSDDVDAFVKLDSSTTENLSELEGYRRRLLAELRLAGLTNLPPIEGCPKSQHLQTVQLMRGAGPQAQNKVYRALLGCYTEYGAARQAICRTEGYKGYYTDRQHRCCYICQAECHGAEDLFFSFAPSPKDPLFRVHRSFSTSEGVFLPLLDPASQFLICAACARASRFRVEPLGGSAMHRRWWPSLDPTRAFPFVAAQDGTLWVTRNRPQEDVNYWPMLVEFNLNRPALVTERQIVFEETQKHLLALISETEDAKLWKLTRQVLTVNDPHALTRHSALLAFCRTRPLPRDDGRPFATSLRQFMNTSDLVDRIFDLSKSHADPDDVLQQALEAALSRLGLPPDLAAPGRRNELPREFAGTFANVCRTLHGEIEPR
jgi:hypothetical protein